MILDDLKKKLEAASATPNPLPDDLRMTIQYRGGIAGSTTCVKSVSQGFDWTNRQLIFTPEMDLCPHEWYRTLKKGAGAGASHVGGVVKAVEAVLENTIEVGDGRVEVKGDLIEKLQKSLDHLERFRKQGF